MSEQIKLTKDEFEARAYKNAIDTSFSQLIPPPPPIVETATVEDFFELYDTLFYEIPSQGEVDSHESLIRRSSEYIGFTEETDQDIQILLDEITQLREELLATQQELRDTQLSGSIQAQSEGNIGGSENIQPGTQLTGQSFIIGG